MTGRDLITASLKKIGAIAPGDRLAADEATDGLAELNRMIDSWSNESLMIYTVVREEFTLVPGTYNYTIGVGGTLATSRPQKIEMAKIKVTNGADSSDYPLDELNLEQWASILNKSASSGIPTCFHIEMSYPLAEIKLYPKPSVAHKLVLFSSKPLSKITTLDTDISFPPGYEDALIYNLAVRLGPDYGKMPNELVFNTATESKASIKRQNHEPSYLTCDSGLVGSGQFNIMTGGYSR